MTDEEIILSIKTSGILNETVKAAVSRVLDRLDSGQIRVAEKVAGAWIVNEYAKMAILLHFGMTQSKRVEAGPFEWFDKVEVKHIPESLDFRLVPGAIVRHGAYIAPSAIIMPSFVNVGAFIGEGTMIDSMVTIGSCAQIGCGVHIGANSCIGGVLEPVNAAPIVIEDGAFVGASVSITEGFIVEEDAVIASGVHLTASTKIIDLTTPAHPVTYGRIPAGSVVIPGSYQTAPGILISAAIIRKKITKKTRKKVGINEILRD